MRAVVFCMYKLLEFGVELIEDLGTSAHSELVADQRVQHELDNIAVNEHETCHCHLEEKFGWNASTRLFRFCVAAVRLQCTFAEESAFAGEFVLRNEFLRLRHRLTRCLPHALRACLRCCPPLEVLQWVTEWACDEERSESVALATVEALSDVLQSSEWRVGQQKGFAAALSRRDLWRFPVLPQRDWIVDWIEEAKLNRLCFLWNMTCGYSLSDTIERVRRAPPTIRTPLLQLVHALLEFGLQLMRQLRSPDDDETPPAESDAPVYQWDPKCIELDERPEPDVFLVLSSASTQLVDFWVTALESELLACEQGCVFLNFLRFYTF